jgi:hypothetical protein
MQTDFGKRLVRQYEEKRDAQTIFCEYVAYYSDSIKAELESTKIYEYLTNTCLGDGTWRGTYHGFILHYTDQFRKYNDMQTSLNEWIPPKTKRRLLENAVAGIPQLAAIKDTANITHANSGKLLDYDNYLALLENAATLLDNRQHSSSWTRTTRSTRTTQRHEFDTYNDPFDFEPPSNHDICLVNLMDTLICDDSLPDDGEIYDIDSPVTVITAQAHKSQTYAGNRYPPRNNPTYSQSFRPTNTPDPEARLAQEIYNAMSRDSKDHWRQIGNPDKLRILGKSATQTPNNSTQTVNLHDISAAEFLELTQHYQDNGTQPESTRELESYAHDTQMKKEPSKMSTADKRSNYSISAHELASSFCTPDVRHMLKHESQDNAYQLTIGGQPYKPTMPRETKAHEIIYRVSAHKHTVSKLPLVDQGSNGMVFGSDVTVFYTHPHQKVCIEGIDSH